MAKQRLIIRRLLQTLPMLLIVTLFAFTLSQLSAGDAAEITLRSQGIIPTPETIAAMRIELGLDRPLAEQYLIWLWHALHADFGVSFQTGEPVTQEILSRFPATLMLALAATALSVIMAVPLALLSVRYKDSALDHFLRGLTTAGAAMPDFWIGLILLYVFAIHFNWVPVIAGNNPANMFLPAFTLSLGYAAMYTRILRTDLIEVRKRPYMQAARARGLGQTAALMRHGLKNASLPSMTLIGVNFGKLLGGQFAIEIIFSWNGIGKFAIDSIRVKDLPIIQGYIVIVALTFILINLLLDLLYMYMDPKIRLE